MSIDQIEAATMTPRQRADALEGIGWDTAEARAYALTLQDANWRSDAMTEAEYYGHSIHDDHEQYRLAVYDGYTGWRDRP